ncbi:hypothetical protein C5L38_33760 (plasmid) [Streptomyces sp. WAC00288]|uniref:hypothetical protein n=1 Tax=unclassified Streptomyces TaxID=2593676 RepID=UPI00078888BF|nr:MULTISPECIES: hypothetical protein [unclassified Streptomyces]AVI00049.1 hypothetical protein C5L38_33760 [Streptomyces sp. WAC00288]KYG51113.1 hypothetical protein AWI43_32185 [Streptomyces sp. WAC04657]
MSNRKQSSRRPGRPSLLTPERIDALVKAASVGVAQSLAAQAVGISYPTLARWMARGRAAVEAREEGQRPDPSDDPYVELHQRVHQARTRMAATSLAQILAAGSGHVVLAEQVRTYIDEETGRRIEERTTRYQPADWRAADWRAAAWWLARTFPEHYGPNSKALDQMIDEYVAKELPAADGPGSPPELAGLAERLQAALARQDKPPVTTAPMFLDARRRPTEPGR